MATRSEDGRDKVYLEGEGKMSALLQIDFTDGTSKVIDLGKRAIEIDLPPTSRQSISINQSPNGGFTLSFTKPIMDGKQFRSITIKKA